MSSDRLTLVRMDLLKLRRRRGLIAIALLIAIGSVTGIFAVRAIRHGVNPTHLGPAGGINAFEGATDFLGLIEVVVTAMIGVTAGAGVRGTRPAPRPNRDRPFTLRAVRLTCRCRAPCDSRDPDRGTRRRDGSLDRARGVHNAPSSSEITQRAATLLLRPSAAVSVPASWTAAASHSRAQQMLVVAADSARPP
jgi:hypothetical protein